MELKEQYKLQAKDNYEIFPRWKYETEFGRKDPRIFNTLEEINKRFEGYNKSPGLEGGFEFVKEETNKKGNLELTFKNVPAADSVAARNPGKYEDHFISYRIVPIVSLDNLKKE